MSIKRLISILVLTACSKAADKPEPLPPTPPVEQVYAETIDRLESSFLDTGWVVSKKHGEPYHIGDSLIWSGLYLYAAPCDRAQATESALLNMLQDTDGYLYRHPTLSTEASLDGALGLWLGGAYRAFKCGSPSWPTAFKTHHNWLQDNDWELNPHSSAKAYPEFNYLPALISARLNGAEAAPTYTRLNTIEIEVAAWAQAVKSTKAACYRAHLGWLALVTAEVAGENISANGRNAFCGATDGLDLPVIDHWCGRPGLEEYLAGFEYDKWEYRHQRCGGANGWEYPDGGEAETPALDRLMALRVGYDL
jgi:hypothetical protein